MVKQVKVDAVESLVAKLERAKSLILTDFRGLTVAEATEIRSKLRAEKAEYKVIKNRLLKIALERAGYDAADTLLEGPTGVAFGYEDPIPAARIISEFVKTNEKMRIKGGHLEKRKIGIPGLERLAKMPSREALLGRLLGSLQSPPTKLVYALHQIGAKLAYALKAVADQKKAAAS